MSRFTTTAIVGGGVVVVVVVVYALRGPSSRPPAPRLDAAVSIPAPTGLAVQPALPAETRALDQLDASPGSPVMRPETVSGLRAAAEPDVRRCLAELRARHPEATGQIGISYELEAHGGRVRITSATANGAAADAEFSACVSTAAQSVGLEPMSEQPDGNGRVTTFYSATD